MNAITLATAMLIVLSTVSSARAGDVPDKNRYGNYSAQIQSQLCLAKEEAEIVKGTSVRFYFTVDSCGRVSKVKAMTTEPMVKKMLEEKFSRIRLKDFPPNQSGNITVRFVMI